MLPANHTLDPVYFERMKNGLGEKSMLVSAAAPGTVLNVGAGGPELSLAFEEAGHRVVSLDASEDSCSRLRAAGLETIHGNAEDLRSLVTEPIHNVVFSSILHEVFSYASGNGREAIRDVLRQAFEILEPGGRILIRDGVKPREGKGVLIAETSEMRSLIEEYIAKSPLVGNEVNAERVSPNRWVGSIPSVLEILNTVNWGRNSLPREMNELFGVFTASEYADELADAEFSSVIAVPCSNTYQRHLESKAHVQDEDGRVMWVPPTAMWIAEKA